MRSPGEPDIAKTAALSNRHRMVYYLTDLVNGLLVLAIWPVHV